MPASVTYIGQDTATQGDWNNTYGSDGWLLADGGAGDPTGNPNNSTLKMLPSYVSFGSTSGSSSGTNLASGSSSAPALTIPFEFLLNARIEGLWYGTFTIDLTITGTKPVWLYFADYDNEGRTTTVIIEDGTDSSTLDSRTISSYQNGIYLGWTVSGHIKVVISTGALAAIFFNQWYSLGNDSFTRADTSYDSTANNTDAVGNNWIDISGNSGRIASDTLMYKGTGTFLGNIITRPSSEAYINQKLIVTYPADDSNTRSFYFRFNGSNTAYQIIDLTGSQIRTYTEVLGATTLIDEQNLSGISSGVEYVLNLTVMRSASTLIFGNLTNLARTTNYGSIYFSYFYADNTSGLQTAGTFAISGTGTSEYPFATNIQWLEGDTPLAPPPGTTYTENMSGGGIELGLSLLKNASSFNMQAQENETAIVSYERISNFEMSGVESSSGTETIKQNSSRMMIGLESFSGAATYSQRISIAGHGSEKESETILPSQIYRTTSLGSEHQTSIFILDQHILFTMLGSESELGHFGTGNQTYTTQMSGFETSNGLSNIQVNYNFNFHGSEHQSITSTVHTTYNSKMSGTENQEGSGLSTKKTVVVMSGDENEFSTISVRFTPNIKMNGVEHQSGFFLERVIWVPELLIDEIESGTAYINLHGMNTGNLFFYLRPTLSGNLC